MITIFYMENKTEIKNISEFFPEEKPELTPGQKWEQVFHGWINKIDEKKLMGNLFELKAWLEALEELFSSPYLENLIFKYQTTNSRDYEFYFATFNLVVGKIIGHLKDLDFQKDRYLLNFEEFIVEKILEDIAASSKAFPYLKDIYSPESWFYSLRIFLQNMRNLSVEMIKGNPIPQKAFFSLRKLYRKEMMSNSIIISLLKGNFIPKMDKIYQQDICDIIADREEKKLKRDIGVFFIFAFRIIKLNNFIELNLNKSRSISITIPLILLLKKKLEHIFTFYDSVLRSTFLGFFKKDEKQMKKIDKIFQNLRLEYQKIYEGEFPYYFDHENEKVNHRKLLKNITIISEMAVQDLIEGISKLFKPEISGNTIFENYTSRAEKASEVKKKLAKLHSKINNYFAEDGRITPADIFFDINQFIETDLNYLLFKDWNEFLNYYNKLVRTDFTPEFKVSLRSFHSFITKILKEMVSNKSA